MGRKSLGQGILDLDGGRGMSLTGSVASGRADRDSWAGWERPRSTPLHEVPLARLSCNRHGTPWRIADADWCETAGEKIARSGFNFLVERMEGEMRDLREPSGVEGFSIAHSGKGMTWGCILVWEDATDLPVAGQRQGTPYVRPEYRGRGLAAQVQLRAFDTGLKTVDDGVFFSAGGLAARRAAHRLAVERAVKQGVEVSEEVLADYPHLQVNAPTPGM